MLVSASFANELEMGYEYGIHSLQSDYYRVGTHFVEKSSFGLHRFVWFDTAGAMTAAVRGAMNESAARTQKELETLEKYRRTGGSLTYEYSWEQPAPVPTDGETWALLIGSEGSPLDAIASQQIAPKTASVLGLEYQRAVWSMNAAPVSTALGLGFRTYYSELTLDPLHAFEFGRFFAAHR